MTDVTGVTGAPTASRATTAPRSGDDVERLRQTGKQLEGLFVQELFKAMRETVPKNGLTSGGNGEEIFTSMFDEQLAREMPAKWHHDLSDAIVAKIGSRLSPPPAKP